MPLPDPASEDQDRFDRICRLLDRHVGRLDRRGRPVTRETRLEQDCGLTGDDAREFLEAFKSAFDVDFSDFRFCDYFGPEGFGLDFGVAGLVRWLRGEPKKFPGIPVTIGHLIRIATLKRWDPAILLADREATRDRR